MMQRHVGGNETLWFGHRPPHRRQGVWHREPPATGEIIVESPLWRYEVRKRNNRCVMNDQEKSRQQLIEENAELRGRIAGLEAQLARTQQAEADQRKINSSLPVLVATAGLDGFYKEVNAAFERLLGWSEQESLSRPFREFIHPDDRATQGESFERLKSGEPVTDFVDRHICKDGSHRWINWTVIPVPGRDIVFGIGHDITEQQQAETALRESEERFRRIFDEGPLGFAIFGPDLRIQHVNKRVCDMLGYSEHELLELGVAGVTYPDDLEKDRQLVLRSLRGEIPYYTIDKRYVRKDGQVFWGQLTAAMIPDADGRPTHGIGMLGDITEQKQAEEVVKQSEQRMRLHVEQTPLAVIEWDLELSVSKWNPGAARIFGYTEEEALGHHFAFLVPSHVREHVDHVRAALLRKKGGERSTNQNMTKDGRTILCEWYNTPLVNAAGQVVGFASLAEDITERTRAEKELQEAHRLLERRVLERTAELTKANKALEREVQQRRRAEEELTMFRRFVEAATQGFGMADIDGQITYVNPFLARLFGVQSPDDVIGKHVSTFYPADYLPRREREIIPALRQREHWQGEQLLAFPDGQMHPTIHTIFPVHDDNGELLCTAAVITDITEQKQAEEAIRQSEEKYRHLVEMTDTGFLILDERGCVVDANDEYIRISGHHALPEILGRSVVEWTAAHDAERNAGEVERCLQQGRVRRLEADYVGADGTVTPVEINANVLETSQGRRILSLCRDITERKRAEEAVRDSEARLNFALEVSGTGAWDLDLSDHTAHRSLQHDRIFGYESLLPSWTYEMFLKHVLPEHREGLDHQFRQAVDTQGDWSFECGIRRSDGQVRWIWAAGRHRPDQRGKPRRMVGIVQDITERKKAEEIIRQSEAKYRALVESCPDAVTLIDLQGRIVFASQRAAEHHGVLGPDELLGRQGTDLVVEGERDRFLANTRRLIEEGVRRNDEYRGLRKDGSTFDAEISSAVIRDAAGNPEALMGVYRDITDRKRADELMRQTLDQLATIYDGMIEGLLITDIETQRFLRVNAPFCRMLGYSEGELLVKAIKDIHPAEEVPNDERRFQAAAEGRVSINEERPVLRKDGSIFYADITGHRVFYDERPCLLALFRDVTERRLAEEKVKAEQQALLRMVLATDHERRLITYELHDGVAQQLLGAKMLFESQQPSTRRKSAMADAYRDGMEALTQASAELRRVMNRLRTPVLDRFGLVEAIKDVASQLRSTPGAPEIECSHDVQFERLEPTLENSLFRIAQEAMTNACRHSQSEKVRVTLTQEGDEVTLEVQDGGIGFDQDVVAEHRFGLEGIRERSRILGGKLSIKSQPGQGTVVRVTFPVIEAADLD